MKLLEMFENLRGGVDKGKRKKEEAFAVAACLLVLSSFGVVRTNTINNGVSDWTLPSSYADTSFVPGPGDVVVLPKNTSVTVYSTDTASFNLVSNLSLVCFTDMSSVLTFDIAEGDDVLIDCRFGSIAGNWKSGQVVKKGKGRITAGDGSKYPLLAKPDSGWYYYCFPLRVEEGEWRCAQGINPGADSYTTGCSEYYSGGVEVWSNATFRLSSGNMLFISVGGLWGDGLVTTTGGQNRQFRIYPDASGRPSVFGGVLDAGVSYCSNGHVFLTGTNSTMSASPVVFDAGMGFATNKGYTAVMKFGMENGPSSLGTNGMLNVVSDSSGGWGYLGEGETTDKTFRWQPNSTGPSMLLDGGANGGLVFTGPWRPATYGVSWIVLTGSNTAPCVVDCSVQLNPTNPDSGWGANSKSNFPVSVTKYGTGTWRFKHSRNRHRLGVFDIQQGTIQADSFEEAGVSCAVGLATNMFVEGYSEKAWIPPEEKRVTDYAFVLGAEASDAIAGEATEGTFEYTGSNSAYCFTRPFVMDGDGRLKNSTEHRIYTGKVSSRSAGAKTLTLDGDSVNTNLLADITDAGGGAISLAKEGTGTWIVSGTNDIRGDIAVKAGTLILQNINSQPYTWHKWVIRENYTPDGEAPSWTNVRIRPQEFGLFDSSGARVNIGLTHNWEYQDLDPGQAAFATFRTRYGWVRIEGHIKDVDTLSGDVETKPLQYFFDNAKTTGPRVNLMTSEYSSGLMPLRESNPLSWIDITMRLADGAGEAVSWDYANQNGTVSSADGQKFIIRSSVVYGSANGVNWEFLDDAPNVPKRSGECMWSFDGRAIGGSHTNCNTIASRVQGVYPFLGNMSGAVSVASGATLVCQGATTTFSKLKLDASGAGTIRGAAFAANGEISVENVETKDAVVFEGLFDGCADEANVADWTICVNGRITSGRTATVRGGMLRIDPKGLIMTLR